MSRYQLANRKDFEKYENIYMASFAQKSSNSRGRIYSEDEHNNRTVYQRDRDRIIHCRAFRRLEYKTQVFVNHEGDHYRTRLTHTMEVAQIARNMSRCLRLNEDLSEAISLAHDVGHPPFGHSGERGLNQVMKSFGGFEHNVQSLRILQKLEKKYPQFDGLNLSIEVLDGLKKHQPKNNTDSIWTLEALLSDFCDELAYNCHDLDDGLSSGMLKFEQVLEIPVWQKIYHQTVQEFKTTDTERLNYYCIRNLINYFVMDALYHTEKLLLPLNGMSNAEIQTMKKKWISFSDEVKEEAKQLKKFLNQNLYRHQIVEKMNHEAIQIVQDLFYFFQKNPDQLPQSTIKKVKNDNNERVICDYIAGMTDRYAIEFHQKYFSLKKRIY